MQCNAIQNNGKICNRPVKIKTCCGYHSLSPIKNKLKSKSLNKVKQVNDLYSNYKKNRKWVDKISFNIDKIKKDLKTKVAIIVPYRDNPDQNRAVQLKEFINYYHNYLPELDIYIIEQDEGKKFNRGKLLNIGFELSSEKNNYDQYIFHDVDLISPKELAKVYAYKAEDPVHIGGLWKEKYTFGSFLGGIISFNKETYEAINGFPNCFFGWGGEDDAMYNRLAKLKIPVLVPNSNEIEIKGMEHSQSKSDDLEKKANILEDLKIWKEEGLNSLEGCYNIISNRKLKYDNIRKIKVKI
jgi:hypothetical protein